MGGEGEGSEMGKAGKGRKMNENLSHCSRTCLRINMGLQPLFPSSLHGQELGNQPK